MVARKEEDDAARECKLFPVRSGQTHELSLPSGKLAFLEMDVMRA